MGSFTDNDVYIFIIAGIFKFIIIENIKIFANVAKTCPLKFVLMSSSCPKVEYIFKFAHELLDIKE